MASLTIRKLDDAVKTYLRLRSAQNHRSVEEEVRVILRALIERAEVPPPPFAAPAAPAPAPPSQRASALPEASVTLIIGGGIAAYKSLDLILRLEERPREVRWVVS